MHAGRVVIMGIPPTESVKVLLNWDWIIYRTSPKYLICGVRYKRLKEASKVKALEFVGPVLYFLLLDRQFISSHLFE